MGGEHGMSLRELVRDEAVAAMSRPELFAATRSARLYFQRPEAPGFFVSETEAGPVVPVFTSWERLALFAGACAWASTTVADLVELLPEGVRPLVDPLGPRPSLLDVEALRVVEVADESRQTGGSEVTSHDAMYGRQSGDPPAPGARSPAAATGSRSLRSGRMLDPLEESVVAARKIKGDWKSLAELIQNSATFEIEDSAKKVLSSWGFAMGRVAEHTDAIVETAEPDHRGLHPGRHARRAATSRRPRTT